MATPEWDTSKENFAPIRTGRKVQALREAPLTPSGGKGCSEEMEAKKR